MLPDLTLLLALLLGLTALVPGPADPLLALGGTAAVVCVTCALSMMARERGLRAADAREEVLAAAHARWTGLWPLLGWMACILLCDWGMYVASVVGRAWWLGQYVVLFAPLGAMFAVGWASRARVEAELARLRGARVSPPTGRAAVTHALRRNAVALLPLFVLFALLDGLWILGRWGVPGMRVASQWIEALPLLALVVMLGLLGVLTFFLPGLFRRVLRTRPLPAGPLRTRLEQQADALGLRYRDLVLWQTQGRVLNAMVVGFTPGTRTIFLTDGLLDHLPEDEVLAVFSHEAGHARRHHLPLFLLLFVASALLFQVAGGMLEDVGISAGWMVGLHLAFLWFVLLGSISRFFEREADVYGADHAAATDVDQDDGLLVPGLKRPLPGGAARMMRALDRIRRLSGRSTSHRHGTIEDRVRYVAAYATDPEVRARFRRTRRRLLGVIAVASLLALVAAAWRAPTDVELARARLDLGEGMATYERAFEREHVQEAPADAAPTWQEAAALFARVHDRLEGRDDVPAVALRLEALFDHADTVLHGLRDETAARPLYEALLHEIPRAPLDAQETAPLRFQAHVDLARILVHQGEVEAAEEHRRAAGALPAGPQEEGDYRDRRLELLDAVLDGARGEAESARRRLELLASGDRPGMPWVELRDDARREAERLRP